MTAAVFLVLTVAGALGATAAAAWGAPPSAFGGALALAFIGLAGAAGAAASALRAPGDLTEPRTVHGPTHPPPLPADARLTRPVFGRMWIAAAGAFAVLGLVPLISLARKPGRRARTGWGAGVRLVDEDDRPIPHDYLADGGIATVFPQGATDLPEAPAVLIRGDDGGYRAFSKVCTHAGCPVALYRHASHQLICPCHQSIFDVQNAAKNISGPAPRPLPALALDVDAEGYLIARGDFDGPVGPDDWDRVR
jgi:ubiquinol-cytochrome c reductase iron-sulfur subunit